jgi:hypothetical protein
LQKFIKRKFGVLTYRKLCYILVLLNFFKPQKTFFMARASYPCSQSELYQGLDLLAASLREHLSRFAARKAKYTTAFVDAFEAQINAARDLPDEQQRTADAQVLYREMTLRVDNEVVPNMNFLKIYIRDTWEDEVVREVRMKEAGFDDLEKVRAKNWDAVKATMKKALDFITLHTVELSVDNMPAGFPVEFQDMKEEVTLQINTFMNMRDNAPVGTDAKVVANNEVYAAGMDICEDGQVIFSKEPTLKQQFVWSSIMDLVTPPGAAGLKIFVRDGVTFMARVSAEVKIQRPGEPVITLVTDADGFVHFTNLPAGTYVGNITGAGYPEFNFEVTIETGVTSTKHYDTMPL